MAKIAPMPAFADPNCPEALGGSINFGLSDNHPPFEDHPVEHSEDYAAGALAVRGGSDDREEWTRDQWADLARNYGLPVGGTKQEVRDRVEEHEASSQGGE